MVELATHVGYYKHGEQEKKIRDVYLWRLPSLGFLTSLILPIGFQSTQ